VAAAEPPLNSQHWLSYTVRGPEWAFAVPQGDLEALEEIMGGCSTFWNGAGSLIIPVRRDGRIPEVIDWFLRSRPVDGCFWHESLSERAVDGLQRKIGGAQRLWDGFDRHENHPLHLVERPGPDDVKPAMKIPTFPSARLRRAVLALWGFMQDADVPFWQEKFDVDTCAGSEAHVALTNGQIEGAGESPLRCTQIHMHAFMSGGIDAVPYIWVLPNSSFGTLLAFWNFRSRATAPGNGASVVGVLAESLAHPERLAALKRWIPRLPGRKTIPDAFVACGGDLMDEVRAGLTTVPMEEDLHKDKYGSESIQSGGVEHNETPTYGFVTPHLSPPFARGVNASALLAFVDGKSSTALPVPQSFTVRNFQHVRVIYNNLPLPLPLTEPMARRVHRDATVHDGLMLLTNAAGPWAFTVQLPTAEEALHDWLSGHGFALERTGESRDADSILSRLGDLDGLEALADRKRIALLDVLAPKPPKKLAQHIVAEAQKAGSNLSEQTIVELLTDSRVFLQTEARTATDIGSAIHERRPEVLNLLAPLVGSGFVRRGYALECPQCHFVTSLRLGEAEELVRCSACGQAFEFPTVIGQEEPAVSYRLDGLMASAMSWDVVPVLLTLRAARKRLGVSPLFCAWPELNVLPPGDKKRFNIDLLVSTGRDVWCYEVKLTAGNLKQDQFERLLKVSSQLGARPSLAALNGEFDPEVIRKINEAHGQVFIGEDLAPT
jgi:hypothetical protein